MGKNALIISCDEFDDPAFSKLRAPADDAEALTDVLRNPAIGAFEVKTIRNQVAHELEREIEAFFDDRRLDDLLLLYFSGHGVKDQNGRLYLATKNTELARLASTGVSATFVAERMESSRSRRIVLMLDCCYSGAFPKGMAAKGGGIVDVGEQLAGRGHVVITASSATEYAFEGTELSVEGGMRSVFSGAVVRGLQSGDADLDQDGTVTIQDLYDYVYAEVRSATPSQKPMMVGSIEGPLALARSARVAFLPEGLRILIASSESKDRLQAVGWLGSILGDPDELKVLNARRALEELALDDSRSVSSAATAVLERFRRKALPDGSEGGNGDESEGGNGDGSEGGNGDKSRGGNGGQPKWWSRWRLALAAICLAIAIGVVVLFVLPSPDNGVTTAKVIDSVAAATNVDFGLPQICPGITPAKPLSFADRLVFRKGCGRTERNPYNTFYDQDRTTADENFIVFVAKDSDSRAALRDHLVSVRGPCERLDWYGDDSIALKSFIQPCLSVNEHWQTIDAALRQVTG